MTPQKTARHNRARAAFDRTGQSITAWAEAHGFTATLVYAVLAGRKPALRGKSHQIAVLLGIKPNGQITDGPAAVTTQLRRSTQREPA